MLNKNNLLTGILLALVAPVVAWLVEYVLKYNPFILSRPAVPYLAAIGVNLFLVRVFLKKDADLTSRGIMMATFVVMLLLFIFQIRLR